MYLDRATNGGAERQMTILARALARLGVNVCHVLESAEGLPQESDGVRLIAEASPSPGDGAVDRVRRIVDGLRRADAQIYLQRSAGLVTGVVGAFARSHRRKFIYSTSGPMDLTHDRALPLRWHEDVSFRVGLPLANAVVVQTHEQAAAARRRRNLLHIPSFCEPKPGAIAQRDTLLWVGRPASYKNPLAFVRLARDVPEARFVMVGIAPPTEDPSSEPVVAAAVNLPNLTLLPQVPASELDPLYRRAVAVVNTSDFEGFPNALLEGWARGALGLSLSIDPDHVLTRHGIGTVADGSPPALAAAARRMWRDRDRSEHERELAVRYVEDHHAPDKVARKWLGLVSKLLT
jgi:glycosyltransferase involved in cell wall biosynthesis